MAVLRVRVRARLCVHVCLSHSLSLSLCVCVCARARACVCVCVCVCVWHVGAGKQGERDSGGLCLYHRGEGALRPGGVPTPPPHPVSTICVCDDVTCVCDDVHTLVTWW